MGIKHLENIKVKHKRGIVPLKELSRKDHIRLEVVLMDENNKLRDAYRILILSNQRLRKQASYLRGKLREKVS